MLNIEKIGESSERITDVIEDLAPKIEHTLQNVALQGISLGKYTSLFTPHPSLPKLS